MKQSNYRSTQKRRIWGARLEMLTRRVERWLDENHEKAFFGFVMACLFLFQFLLFLR
jgi:hypothetical protein